MFHGQVVSFDWYIPYFLIKAQEICIFSWLISSSLYTVIPSLIFVNNKNFPFQFWWNITFHKFFDVYYISRPACFICILLFYEKTTISLFYYYYSLWHDSYRVWMIFINVTLRAVFIRICMIMFISNKVFLCVSMLTFDANMALCR